MHTFRFSGHLLSGSSIQEGKSVRYLIPESVSEYIPGIKEAVQ